MQFIFIRAVTATTTELAEKGIVFAELTLCFAENESKLLESKYYPIDSGIPRF